MTDPVILNDYAAVNSGIEHEQRRMLSSLQEATATRWQVWSGVVLRLSASLAILIVAIGAVVWLLQRSELPGLERREQTVALPNDQEGAPLDRGNSPQGRDSLSPSVWQEAKRETPTAGGTSGPPAPNASQAGQMAGNVPARITEGHGNLAETQALEPDPTLETLDAEPTRQGRETGSATTPDAARGERHLPAEKRESKDDLSGAVAKARPTPPSSALASLSQSDEPASTLEGQTHSVESKISEVQRELEKLRNRRADPAMQQARTNDRPDPTPPVDRYPAEAPTTQRATAEPSPTAAGDSHQAPSATHQDKRIAREEERDSDVESGILELEHTLEALRKQQAGLTAQLELRDTEIAEMKKTHEALARSLSSEIESGRISLEQARKGIRVVLADDILFPTGSAELSAAGSEIVLRVAHGLQESGYRIRVEGHTDDVPIRGQLAQRYHTNWELAGARATSVVRLLEGSGIDGRRLEAASLGQKHPVASNEEPAGRSRNRRIEIRLLPNESAVSHPASPAP